MIIIFVLSRVHELETWIECTHVHRQWKTNGKGAREKGKRAIIQPRGNTFVDLWDSQAIITTNYH